MKVDKYLAQREMYFSESESQLKRISDMAYPHAFYADQKLRKELGDMYLGSPLWEAFDQKLNPSAAEVRRLLRETGRASHTIAAKPSESHVRTNLRNAAKRGGIKVSTHKERGLWITAEVIVPAIRVKGKLVA